MLQAARARQAGLKVWRTGQAAACAATAARQGTPVFGRRPSGRLVTGGLAVPGTPLRERRLHTQQGLWLSIENQPDGSGETIAAGCQAREALRREVPRHEGRHSARRAGLADQAQRAIERQPHLQTALLASSMLAGLEHPLRDLLAREAPGIRHGLALLRPGADDAVAECDPGDLALPVALALAGCRVTLMHGDMLTSARMANRGYPSRTTRRVRARPPSA